MSNTASIQETYYAIIRSLYGNTLSLSLDDINENVVEIVDTTLDQIAKCHHAIKPIALIFEGLAIFIKSKYPPEVELLVGSKDWAEYIEKGDGTNTLINAAKVLHAGGVIDEIPTTAKLFQGVYQGANLLEAFSDFYDVYLEYNRQDRRMMMCINRTKLYWRSPLQLALIGL